MLLTIIIILSLWLLLGILVGLTLGAIAQAIDETHAATFGQAEDEAPTYAEEAS